MLGCHVFAACFYFWPVYGFFDLSLLEPVLSAFSLVKFVEDAQ